MTNLLTRAELSDAMKCGALRQGPMFYRVTIETIVPNVAAIQRQAGLEAMLGGAVDIAEAMSPERGYGEVVDRATRYVGLDDMMTLDLAQLIGGRR